MSSGADLATAQVGAEERVQVTSAKVMGGILRVYR